MFYLFENYRPTEILDLKDFLISNLDKDSLHDAKIADNILKELSHRRFFSSFYVNKKRQETCNIGDDWGNGRPPGTISNYDWGAGLNTEGYERVGFLIAEKKTKSLLIEQSQSIINTNESVQTTNLATQNLYNKVLPRNFNDQKRSTTLSLLLATLSVFFIAITAYLQCNDQTPKKLQELKYVLDSTSKKLDSLSTRLKEVNSSIIDLKKDSTLRNASPNKLTTK